MPFYPACRLSLADFDVGRLPGENRLSAPENLCPAFPVSRQRCRRRAALPYKGSGVPARRALGPGRGSRPSPCTSCALEAFCFIRHNFLTENRVGEISSLLAARGACCNSSYFHFAPLRIKNRDTQISVPEISFFHTKSTAFAITASALVFALPPAPACRPGNGSRQKGGCSPAWWGHRKSLAACCSHTALKVQPAFGFPHLRQ